MAEAIAIFDGATRLFAETMTAHGIALFAAITQLINTLTVLYRARVSATSGCFRIAAGPK